jgi:O-antigen ligase
LVVGIIRRQEWSQFSVLFDGARSGFGRGIPQMGLFSAAAVLGMLILARRFWGSSKRRFVLRVVVWAALLGLLTQVLIISQSRVSWIALLIAAPALVGYHIRGWIKDRSAVSWTHVAPAVALAVVLLAGLILGNFSTIRNRVLLEAEMVQALVAGETDRVPVLSPLGARFHLAQHGMHEWLKRPVFGWGPGTQVAEFAPKPLSDFGHLHNTYLEILARFGLVGALLLAAGVGLIVRSSVAAYRTGRLPQDYFLYLCGAFGLLAIWSAANFRLSADWRFYCILWGALAYAVRLQDEHSPARSLGRQGHLDPINE